MSLCWRCLQTGVRAISTQNGPLAFRATNPLWAEPMKKKKKVDAGALKARENKRIRKLEKEIRRKVARGSILKPVEEIEGDRSVIKTLHKRHREIENVSFEESERQALLQKQWARHKVEEYDIETKIILRAQNEQERALEELKKENEQLYHMAVKFDDDMIPVERHGPVSTPPIHDHYLNTPDGERKDVTRLYDN